MNMYCDVEYVSCFAKSTNFFQDEAQREDLRHLDVCSVDPVGCTDIDDALHCRKLQNGNFEVSYNQHLVYPGMLTVI